MVQPVNRVVDVEVRATPTLACVLFAPVMMQFVNVVDAPNFKVIRLAVPEFVPTKLQAKMSTPTPEAGAYDGPAIARRVCVVPVPTKTKFVMQEAYCSNAAGEPFGRPNPETVTSGLAVPVMIADPRENPMSVTFAGTVKVVLTTYVPRGKNTMLGPLEAAASVAAIAI
jgi:hypothetical protein